MKTMKGLDFWTKSAVWLELVCPGYFFGKTFGTADAKYRVLDKFMYPESFINISSFFRDLPPHDLYYTGRFLGVMSGAMIGICIALLIGFFYKLVLKDWAYAKAARVGALAFVLIALLTGFMSDMFCESIGLALKIEEKAPDDLIGKYLLEDYGSFKKGAEITAENAPMLAYYDKLKANNPKSARRWWIGSMVFMGVWFVLYFVCAISLFKRNKVPREAWFKLQMINLAVIIIYMRIGFGLSAQEYHYIITHSQYLFGGH
jgi:hypothetical protein